MPRLAAAIGCCAALAACGGSASAAATVSLSIRVNDGHGTVRTAALRCTDAGAHRSGFLRGSARRLCDRARTLRRFLAAKPDPNRICTQIYGGPQRAHILGHIGSLRVDRRFARRDGCEIGDWERARLFFAGGVANPGL